MLLLHGTGGNERDLIPLGRELDANAALLSPRGKILENGMPRFFRRLAEGVFDLEDLKYRANELADFVSAAAQHYGFASDNLVAAGYSNGANIAGAMLLLRPEVYGECNSVPRHGAAASGHNCPIFHLYAFGSAQVIRIRLFRHPKLNAWQNCFVRPAQT